MGIYYDDNGKGLAEKLRERGFWPYFGVVAILFFAFLSFLDFVLESFLPEDEFSTWSYIAWDFPVNVGLSLIVASAAWKLNGKPLFRINKPDTTKLDLNE